MKVKIKLKPNREKTLFTMPTLKLVTNRSNPPVPRFPPLATLHAGCRYVVTCEDIDLLNTTHGIVGGYQVSISHSKILPVTTISGPDKISMCCFWDTDINLSRLSSVIRNETSDQIIPLKECDLKTNRMLLKSQSLDSPQLLRANGDAVLSMSPSFDFTFCTDSYTAQIGIIHLVEATRFITLENGTEITLLNTHDNEAPVLYLDSPSDEQAVKLVVAQQETGVTREHSYHWTVSQRIPEKFAGESAATVTVLEQYQSFFMQRAIPFDDCFNMWIPCYVPILWGWSIRVGRRSDGEWGILKRKLILPTPGNDGAQLPAWNDNTINCLKRTRP